jgi:hypothetical protein
MSETPEPTRVERTSDRWRYTLDMASAPAYAFLTLHGLPAQDMIERIAADLLVLMDRLVGQEAPFCPVVIDVRKVGSARMGAATFQWASSRALRRVTRMVIIFDPDLTTRSAYAGFMRLTSAVLPHFEVVYSCTEAFERLGLQAPPGCEGDAA